MTVKEKLKEYRRKKYKEEITESIKITIGNVLPWNRNCEMEKLVEESTTKEEVRLYQLLSGFFVVDTIRILIRFNDILINLTNILNILCTCLKFAGILCILFFVYVHSSNITVYSLFVRRFNCARSHKIYKKMIRIPGWKIMYRSPKVQLLL